jgi:hypothetical protein
MICYGACMIVLRSYATFLFLLLLIGCTQSEPATSAATSTGSVPAVSQTTPTILPTNTTVVSLAERETPTATATPVPAATATLPPTIAPTASPTPLPEWAWHDLGSTPIRFQLPDNWQQIFPGYANHDWRRYQSANTNSLIGVRNHAIRGGQDGLTWLRQNQQLQSTISGPMDDIRQNAVVQGRPAFWTASEGGGISIFDVFVDDGEMLLHFFYQSAVEPRQPEEMAVFLTMIETTQFTTPVTGDTELPTGLIESRLLTVFDGALSFDSDQLHTIEGVVAEADFSSIVVETALGSTYELWVVQEAYLFQGGPVGYGWGLDQPGLFDLPDLGENLTIIGYPFSETRLYPLLILRPEAAEAAPILYQRFFELSRITPEPALLAYYPAEANLILWGTWEEIRPYLHNSPDLELAAGEMLLAFGDLYTADPPRLNLTKLYRLDEACRSVGEERPSCQIYHPFWP